LGSKWRIGGSWAGLGMILLAAVVYRGKTLFPGISALLPCLGTGAVIWANLGAKERLWGAGRLLAWRPLVAVGLLSYSLYLWHWPLLAFTRYFAHYLSNDAGMELRLSAPIRVGIVILSLLFAYASWRWVETPVRRRQWLASKSSLFAFGIVSTGLCAALAWILHGTGGLPGRLPPEALRYAEAKLDKPEDWAQVMLWGDSHARCVLPALEEWCGRKGIQAEAAVHNSMSPTLGYYRNTGLKKDALVYSEAVLERVRSQGIRHSVITAYWSRCAGAEDPRPFQEALKKTVTAFRDAGSQVWILLDVPQQDFDVPESLALSAWRTSLQDPRQWVSSAEAHRRINKSMYDIVPELQKLGARILDPLDLFAAPDRRTVIEWQGEALYFDNNHLSKKGAQRISPLLEPIFRE
jgi:hypothetical protein